MSQEVDVIVPLHFPCREVPVNNKHAWRVAQTISGLRMTQ